MKNVFFLITLCLGVCLTACQEGKEDAKSPLSEKDFYKTIGEEIPFETGMEWIDNYRKSAESGRTELLDSYHVTASQIRTMLDTSPDLVGIAFQYATDESGKKHILAVPVDETMKVWTGASGRTLYDTNTGNQISEATASAWAATYRDAHPDGIWFHFFGKDIFEEMSALPFFDRFEIAQGINTLELTPELLLVVWNNELSSAGRTYDADGTVYDASNPCPPCKVN